jgi:hypothetical protein
MEMMNSCAIISFKYLVFSLAFSWVLDKKLFWYKDLLWTWNSWVQHMLDLSLGNWRILYKKVWAIVYLVPSDTKILEIYLLKNIEMLHDEFLYDKAWIPVWARKTFTHICCLLLHWVFSSFVDLYERFVMLLKSRSHAHHPNIHWG